MSPNQGADAARRLPRAAEQAFSGEMSSVKQFLAGSYEVRVQPVARSGRRQWSVTMVGKTVDGQPADESLLYLERFFDSNEAASAYAAAWSSLQAPGRCTLIRG